MISCKEAEIYKKLEKYKGCRYFVYYADREITGGTLPEAIPDMGKVTEIRAFDKNKEIWLHRDSLGTDFYCRETDDRDLSKEDYFDETQLLDIASVFTVNDGKTTFTSTGGGRYTLPVGPKENAVVIRNYLSYNEKTGRAEARDFRVLGFTTAEAEEV